jgi:hypothetical protein
VPGSGDSAADEALARHAEAVATVRAFAAASGAERVVLLVDRGEERDAVMVEALEDGGVEVTDGGRTWTLPPRAPAGARPRPFPDVRPPPAATLAMDPDTGELSAPIGAVANLGAAVLGLARAFGGRSVATAEFATHDPGMPLTIAAREGEPLVVAAGDGRFELPGDG